MKISFPSSLLYLLRSLNFVLQGHHLPQTPSPIPVMWPALLIQLIPVLWPIATHIAPSIPVMWLTPMLLGTLHPRVSSWGNPVSPHPNSTQRYRRRLLLVHPWCPTLTFWLGTLLLRVMPRSFVVRPRHPVLLILVMLLT